MFYVLPSHRGGTEMLRCYAAIFWQAITRALLTCKPHAQSCSSRRRCRACSSLLALACTGCDATLQKFKVYLQVKLTCKPRPHSLQLQQALQGMLKICCDATLQ
jgi:hypothetical protein